MPISGMRCEHTVYGFWILYVSGTVTVEIRTRSFGFEGRCRPSATFYFYQTKTKLSHFFSNNIWMYIHTPHSIKFL